MAAFVIAGHPTRNRDRLLHPVATVIKLSPKSGGTFLKLAAMHEWSFGCDRGNQNRRTRANRRARSTFVSREGVSADPV